MFSVIETGGKQYLVKSGETLRVEKLNIEDGKEFVFDKVLLTANERFANQMIQNKYWHFITNQKSLLWSDNYSNIIPLIKLL